MSASRPPRRLFVAADTAIACPDCGHEFRLEEGLARRTLEGLERDSEAVLSEMRETERATQQRRADAQAREAIEAERKRQTQLEARLTEQQQQLQAMRELELAWHKEKDDLADRKAQLDLEVARKLDAGRSALEARVRGQVEERSVLQMAELQKKLDDVHMQLAAAQRRADQGSQQLQGEVLELAMEDALRRQFPVDVFEEVKKGARGGDIIHRVMTRSGQVAGTILWEVKRTKDWSAPWTAKLKEDMRACGADLGVLVSLVLPREFPSSQAFGLHEEVWVSGWGTAVPLAQALRAGVLDVHHQRLVSTGKGESMEALYDYVTSVQFAQKIRAVVDAFKRMREELESEKTTTQQRWARREKQIQLAMTELIGIAGNVQGLSRQELPELELQPPDAPDPGSA